MSSQLTRGSQETINNTPIINGKIRIAMDTGNFYVDSANARIKISDVVFGLTYDEIIGLESPLPKVYFSTDTHQILIYDFFNEEWCNYAGIETVEKADKDMRGQKIDETYVKDVSFDSETYNIIITYGDNHTTIVPNPLANTVKDLQDTIEIIKENSNTEEP